MQTEGKYLLMTASMEILGGRCLDSCLLLRACLPGRRNGRFAWTSNVGVSKWKECLLDKRVAARRD